MRLLAAPYMPTVGSARMASVGDVVRSRARFLADDKSTMRYLLGKRYEWMNAYIAESDKGVEVGCGAGFSRHYIRNTRYELTDYANFEWLDRKVDALELPYEDDSLDFVIESNMLHHLSSPAVFLDEARRVLKPGGTLLVQDVWGSLLLRALCRLLRTEGYSFDVNVFDKASLCCDPENLWAGNNVIPNLLFKDRVKFSEIFGFDVIRFEHSEVFLFPLSGGVTSHVPAPRLPQWILRMVDRLDGILARSMPSLCALQVSVALRKRSATTSR